MNRLNPQFRACAQLAMAAIAVTLISSVPSYAQSNAASSSEKIVVAQAPVAVPPGIESANAVAFPPLQRGVRAAAEQGPEALRRYVWRTRMIYNYRYDDFAPQE